MLKAGKYEFAKAYKQLLQDSIKVLESGETLPPVTRNYGHLYTVRIARPAEHFLDWDKPLSEQSEYVRERLLSFAAQHKSFERFSPQSIVYEPEMRGQSIYQSLEAVTQRRPMLMNPDKSLYIATVDKELSKAGIAGIKYLDASARGAGEGSRNYVVFNDRDIHITHKNDVPVAREQPLPDFLKAEAKSLFNTELRSADISAKDFSGDLTQRAYALIDNGVRLDHASAYEDAAIGRAAREASLLHEAFGDEVHSGTAQEDGAAASRSGGEGPEPSGQPANASQGLRSVGEAGSSAGGAANARRADATYLGGEQEPGRRSAPADHGIADGVAAGHEPGGILEFINRDEPLSGERADFLADLIEACRV